MKLKFLISFLFVIFLITNVSAELVQYPVDSEWPIFQKNIYFDNITDIDDVSELAYDLVYFIFEDYCELVYEDIYHVAVSVNNNGITPEPNVCLSQTEFNNLSERYNVCVGYLDQLNEINDYVNQISDEDSEEFNYFIDEKSRRREILNTVYDYSHILNDFIFEFVSEDEKILSEIGKAHVNDLNYAENCFTIYYFSDFERLVNEYDNMNSSDFEKSVFEDILRKNSNLDNINILTYLKYSESSYSHKYLSPLGSLSDIPYECNFDSSKGICEDIIIPEYINIENFKEHNLLNFKHSDFEGSDMDVWDVWDYVDDGYSIIEVIEDSGINKDLITSVEVVPEHVPMQEDDSLYYSFSYKKDFKIFGIKLFSRNKYVKVDIQTKEFK